MTSMPTKSVGSPSSVTPSFSSATTSKASEREIAPEISRAHGEQLDINSCEDHILLQSTVSDQISVVGSNQLNAGESSLALRKHEVWVGTVPGDAALGDVVFDFDPFTAYFNLALDGNSSLSAFHDVYFDLELTVVVHALPSFSGELRVYFNRFNQVGATNRVRYSYDPTIIDVSNKESAQVMITMELPTQAMPTVPTAYSAVGVGNAVCFVSLPIVSPTGSVQAVQMHVFAEPKNVRAFNYVHRHMVTLQTALQPLDPSITQDVTMRLPVSNVLSPTDVAGRYGYVSNTTIASNRAIGDIIVSLDVHPLAARNTPLGAMSFYYAYYRGAIKYRFTLNLSKFQNVSLAYIFVPQGSAFTYANYETFPFQTVQFDQSHSCEIELNYAAGSNWLPCYQSTRQGAMPAPPAPQVRPPGPPIFDQAAFGSLIVFLHSPLISSAAPASDPTLLVEVAAGTGFELAHPRDGTMSWRQAALVQALNENVPRNFVSASGNVYSDCTLPHFLTNITLDLAHTKVIPVTPMLARSGLLNLLCDSYSAWSGSLEFIFEATTGGQCEIRYDPVHRYLNAASIGRVSNCPRDGYIAFVNSRTNRHAVVHVPWCSLFDYAPLGRGPYANAYGGATNNGSLFINGDGTYRVYVRAGADFKLHFYNGVHRFIGPFTGDSMQFQPDVIVNGGDEVNTANRVASTQAGFLGLSGLDTDTINGAAADVRTLLADIREVVPKVSSLTGQASKTCVTIEMVTDFLAGPGRLMNMASNLVSRGLSSLTEIVTELLTMIQSVLEVVTPSYIWQFLSNTFEVSFSEEELGFLYAITIFSGAMAIGIDNPWKVICAISVAGLTIPLLSKVIPRLVTQMFEFFSTPAVSEEVANTEALSLSGTIGTLLTMIISFIIPSPTGKGALLKDLSSLGKDISGIFSGAKAIDEMTTTLVAWVLDMPAVRKTLGINFDDIALLSTIDVEAYVEEVRSLMLADFCNTAMDGEKVLAQERLTAVRKQLEQFLSKHTGTSFFLNTTLRKVFDEQEKMHKHSLTYKGHAKERFPPYIFMLFGETRVGKSVFAANFNRSLALMMNWDVDTAVYTRVNSDPYFSGLGHHKILYMDDAHTNITADGTQSDCSTIMAFGSNAPYAPRMASLEDKGRTVNATFGFFVTNTPGAPHDSGIRNIDAYLARRNALVHMRWKAGVTEYESDFSHAEFLYVDPKDPNGRDYLDADWKKVSVTGAPPLVHSAQQLWDKISNDYVEHLCEQRKLRHERIHNKTFESRPVEYRLDCARVIAANFDNLDALPITALTPATTEASSPMQENFVTGGLKEYKGILEMFGDNAVANAYLDIYYVPRTKTFVWLEKKEGNRALYEALQETAFSLRSIEMDAGVHASDIFPWLKFQNEINQAALAILANDGLPEEEIMVLESDIYDVLDPMIRSFVRNEVVAQRCLRERAAKLDTCGNFTVMRALGLLQKKIPRWFKVLMLGASMGAVVYGLSAFLTGKKESAKPSMATLLHPPVQYEKELAPSLVLPVKEAKRVLVSQPQYEKELAPSLALPVKEVKMRTLSDVQYEKELVPSLVLPVKETVKSMAKVYGPTGVNEEATLIVCKPQSAQESELVETLYSTRVARVVRQNVNQSAVLLSNTELLLNRHFFTSAFCPLVRSEELIVTYQGTDGNGYVETRVISPKSILPVPGKDIVLCVLSECLPSVRSSWNLVASEAMMAYAYAAAGWLVVRSRRGSLKIVTPSSITRRKFAETAPVYFNMDGSSGVANETVCFLDGFDYRAGTTTGDCGSPLILSGMQQRIFGIHTCAFQDGAAYSQYVTREMLEAVKVAPGKLYPWQHGDVVSMPAPVMTEGFESLTGVLAMVQAMIDTSCIKLEIVKIVPVTESVRGCCSTSYRRSPIDPYFPIESYREPAILSPHDSRLKEEYNPCISILDKYSTPIAPLNEEILQEVVDHLIVHYKGMNDVFASRSFMNLEEAINGIPGAPFYDRINMHSSPGLPYTLSHHHKKASMFVTTTEYHDGSFRHECLVPRVEQRFNEIIALARKGKRLDDVVYQEFLKDELLPRKKIYTKPATRGIANPPLDLLLAMRAAFLPFIARVQYNRHISDCQVGLNALSGKEWTRMIHRLKANSDLVFDADYSAFDSTIHGNTLDAFADIVNGTMGGTFTDILARRTLVSYVYNRVSQVSNVQVRVTQGMASGTPITAPANSIINMMYIRYAWIKLARTHEPTVAALRFFDDNVKMIAYGDDNVVTVKSQVAHWFNLRTISATLLEYGIKMTDGQKNTGDAVKPFAEWKDIRFLKRAMVWDEVAMLYRSPLDLKTMLDRLRFVKSKAIVEDMMMRIHATMMDAMLHGPQVMHDLQTFINATLKEIKLPPVSYSYIEAYKVWSTAGMVADVQTRIKYVREQSGVVDVFRIDTMAAPDEAQSCVPTRGPNPPTAAERAGLKNAWFDEDALPGLAPQGLTLAEVQNAITTALAGLPAAPTVQQIVAAIPARIGVTLPQVQQAIAAGIATIPPPLTLADMQQAMGAALSVVPNTQQIQTIVANGAVATTQAIQQAIAAKPAVQGTAVVNPTVLRYAVKYTSPSGNTSIWMNCDYSFPKVQVQVRGGRRVDMVVDGNYLVLGSNPFTPTVGAPPHIREFKDQGKSHFHKDLPIKVEEESDRPTSSEIVKPSPAYINFSIPLPTDLDCKSLILTNIRSTDEKSKGKSMFFQGADSVELRRGKFAFKFQWTSHSVVYQTDREKLVMH